MWMDGKVIALAQLCDWEAYQELGLKREQSEDKLTREGHAHWEGMLWSIEVGKKA